MSAPSTGLTATRNRRPEFGLQHRLVLAREVAHLDQTDIATALDVSRATISNYENGRTKPGRLQLREWARVCDVDYDWLIRGAEPRSSDYTFPLPDRLGSAPKQKPRSRTDATRPGGTTSRRPRHRRTGTTTRPRGHRS